MARNTDQSMTRALGRRAAQLVLAGAVVATPLALGSGIASADTDWDAVAQCESGGNWSTDTGNGFSGGLQFTPSTWKAFGGSGSPEGASRSEQIEVAEKVKAEQGMNAWPTCSKKTGETDSSANSSSKSSKKSSSDSDDEATSTQSTSGSSASSAGSSEKSSEKASTKAAPKSAPKAAKAAPTSGSYTVKSGDTLSSIAASNGTSSSALAEKNDIANPDVIATGQKLAMS